MSELEVILPNGDRATCDERNVNYTVRYLCDEAAVAYGGFTRLKRDVIVTRDGSYDGALTRYARGQ